MAERLLVFQFECCLENLATHVPQQRGRDDSTRGSNVHSLQIT